ncbi:MULTISPECIES: biotin/lipoyl-containing protein [Arthrobacter]|uniref:Pyruvate/2-oxoglutarate dehydrogenase complex dihydrolipoamide acyltransferase (E2) component n=1 Tax=Arthrobacter bambusae TaxID=1338426 RepID=A0AAW8DEA5_9MICC|nr:MULTISPECIES: biotin/lipoyl-containing protein [Arthrobacter]MDP9906035.1 pyruvate/2-oxoglutarate dehydrogenase complex dihydrolipoamide acyltransferase (E2) component [Arthrobacter bambusae]MDQ0131170.1 pyruvate/2-oxoglutarate dehydrogenase complex dihydrolipoamide acyltransferase (E2) component [Arthrobacter bambusae]MDQ0181838.1 pyruvate/2-oxoglutarate dehydrogenase complex dihydrolipoamide acyltransferase (E2) component [Arthrobacter bambusae]
MSHQVFINDLGDGVEEAVFAAWLKDVGDFVAVGEPIAEVMTDKVNLEIESTVAGVLTNQDCEPEDSVRIGQVIGVIEVQQES